METFKANIKFQDGRYYVTWPWKEKHPDFPSYRELAYGKLKSCLKKLHGKKIVSEYDQEIPQSQTADNPMAPRGRAAQPSRDTRKTN